MDAATVIEALQLKPLPDEGGYFREMYRAQGRIRPGVLSSTSDSRSFYSSILYLVTPETFSSLHRLAYEEVFHFYLGDPVRQVQIVPNGELREVILGHDILNGQVVQSLVQANRWQGTRLLPGGKWALLGTTMAPAFDWNDFELGIRSRLVEQFPEHKAVIEQYTAS